MSFSRRWALQVDICRHLHGVRTVVTRNTTAGWGVLRRRASTNTNTGPTLLTYSAVEGPTQPPLVDKTLPAYFKEDILNRYAERSALICRGEGPRPHGGPHTLNLGVEGYLAWSFAELDEHIRALARGLVGLGVKKGDRVGVIMSNNSAYAMLQWACASIGAMLVTLNPAYRLPELVQVLSLVEVSHLFVVPRIRSSNYVSMFAEAFPALRNSAPGAIEEPALPSLRHLVVVDDMPSREDFKTVLEGVRPAVDFREVVVWREDASEQRVVNEIQEGLLPDDIMSLQFTSGTTGAPKAVSLTHHNLLNNALSIGRCMRLTPNDMLCNPTPLFHCFDKLSSLLSFPSELILSAYIRLVLANLTFWTHGSGIVYPSAVYDPSAVVDAMVQEKCTAIHGVPTHFLGVLAEIEKRHEAGETVDLSRLRTGIAAGSPVPTPLMKKLVERMNLTELTIAYGMTETSPVSFQTTPDDPLEMRVDTVGKILPHVKAKIVDTSGNIVPINTPGELHVAGYVLQKGYWRDEEQTSKVMQRDAEGTLWMHTGDEAIIDEEGYLRIVGRIKDIIIRGGENLFPVQIENVLMAHPAILEAAAVAVPDHHYGEVVGAWIVRDPHHSTLSREDVRRTVAQGMNPQNAPAWVWFIGEDSESELPKTASGKVQKHVLRKWSKTLAEKGVGRVLS